MNTPNNMICFGIIKILHICLSFKLFSLLFIVCGTILLINSFTSADIM